MKLLGFIIFVVGVIRIVNVFVKKTDKGSSKKKLPRVVLSSLVIIMGITIIGVNSEESEGGEVGGDVSEEERYENIAVDVMGDDGVESVTYFDGHITYGLKADDNLTIKAVYQGILIDSEKIIESLVDSGYSGDVAFMWDYEDVKKAVSFTILEDDLDSATRDNIEEISEDFSAHQSFVE